MEYNKKINALYYAPVNLYGYKSPNKPKVLEYETMVKELAVELEDILLESWPLR